MRRLPPLFRKYGHLLFREGWGLKSSTLAMGSVYLFRAAINYLYQVIAVRSLGLDPYGVYSVVFSSLTIVSFILGQSAETLVSKNVAEARSGNHSYTRLLKHTFLWLTLLSLLSVAIGLSLRDLVVTALLPEAPYLFYFLLAIGILESYDIAIRGVLRGLQATGMYGMSFIIKNVFRILFFVLLVNGLGLGLIGAGWALCFAAIGSILFIVLVVLRLARNGPSEARPQYRFKSRALLRYELGMMVTFGLMAVYYYIGPLLIKLLGFAGANELAGTFMLATYLSRFPIQISEALTVNLLPHMSRLDVQNDVRRGWRYVVQSYQVLVPAGIASVVVLYVWGPWALHLIHEDINYSHIGMGLLGVNGLFMMLSAVSIQFLLSRSRVGEVVGSWLVGCIILVVAPALTVWPILTRLEISYALSGAIMWGIVLVGSVAISRRIRWVRR
jgi:O-antigen/teichoic acid export membrane protein